MNNLTASNQQMAWMYLGRGAWGGGSLVAMLPSYISSSQSAYSSHLGLAGLAGKSHQTSFITSDTDNATENMSLKNKVRVFTVDGCVLSDPTTQHLQFPYISIREGCR